MAGMITAGLTRTANMFSATRKKPRRKGLNRVRKPDTMTAKNEKAIASRDHTIIMMRASEIMPKFIEEISLAGIKADTEAESKERHNLCS